MELRERLRQALRAIDNAGGDDCLAQRPPLDRPLSDVEEDCRDWGFALGLAVGMARAEEPYESLESVLGRAVRAAVWMIELCTWPRGYISGERPCFDCGRDCFAGARAWREGRWYDVATDDVAQWYVVTEGAWPEDVPGLGFHPQQERGSQLCLDCLEKRIGRPLERADFYWRFGENRHACRVVARRGSKVDAGGQQRPDVDGEDQHAPAIRRVRAPAR